MGYSKVIAEAISGSSQQLEANGVDYHGFSLRETGGAVATVKIRNGGVTGVVLDDIEFNPDESVREWYEGGLRADHGLYVEIVAGSVEGTVRIA